MKTAYSHPAKRFTYGLFSGAIEADGWLYVSGMGPLDMETGRLVPGSMTDQTLLTLSHIERVLAEAGCSRDDVVKCTCYLADLGEFEEFNMAYGDFFTGIRPARTTVQAGLMKQMKLEIDCVARMPRSGDGVTGTGHPAG